MDFYEIVRTRRSIRAYSDQPVEQAKLDRIWEAAQLAPTACNLQPFKILVATSAAARAAVRECCKQDWIDQAPVVAVVLGNRATCWKRLSGKPAHDVDATIVLDHIVLAATAEGLGTCWVYAFDQEKLHDALGLGPDWEPIGLTPIGYAAERPAERPRKEIDQIVKVIEHA